MRRLLALSVFTPLIVAATNLTPEQAARAFGNRPAVEDIKLSPDGSKIAFLEPLPNQGSLLYVASLADGKPRAVTRAAGDPFRLQWCDWVNEERLICELYGLTTEGDVLLAFARLISVNADGSGMKELKAGSSPDAMRVSVDSGEVLDWLDGKSPEVLMARDHVAEARSDFRLVKKQDGLCVDRIITATLAAKGVELPR